MTTSETCGICSEEIYWDGAVGQGWMHADQAAHDHKGYLGTPLPYDVITRLAREARDRKEAALAAEVGLASPALGPRAGAEPPTLLKTIDAARAAGWRWRDAGSGRLGESGAWRGVRLDVPDGPGWVRLWKAGSSEGEPTWSAAGCWRLEGGQRHTAAARDLDAALKAAQPEKQKRSRKVKS